MNPIRFFNKVFIKQINPRTYWLVIVVLALTLLFSLANLLVSPTVAAKNNAEPPAVSEGLGNAVPFTTTTPTASLTPTGTLTATVTPTSTATITPTSTSTPTPTPTSTPTLAGLIAYLPAISKAASPTPTPTLTPTPLPKGIHGYVTLNGAPVSGVFLDLRFYNGSEWSTYTSTTTDSAGYYSILNVAALGAGQRYYIRYLNQSDPTRMFTWHTEVIESYLAGADHQFITFEIGNIYLISPSAGATVPVPYTFQWSARAASPTDNYEFDLFDYEDGDPYFWTNPALGFVDHYDLTSLPTGFGVGQWYVWGILVFSPSGDDADGYGISYYLYYVMFSTSGEPVITQMPVAGSKWVGENNTSEFDLSVIYPNRLLGDE